MLKPRLLLRAIVKLRIRSRSSQRRENEGEDTRRIFQLFKTLLVDQEVFHSGVDGARLRYNMDCDFCAGCGVE